MTGERRVVIEIFGEGKTDVGDDAHGQVERPTKGVLPILLRTLCGKPADMFVKRHKIAFLQQEGGLRKKVAFAKWQARINGSSGATFVVDSDGDLKGRTRVLTEGREMEPGQFPVALGVAHPCIEAWLLTDGPAIRRALDLESTPDVRDAPEELPAPRSKHKNNPKVALATAAGSSHSELSVADKEKIAAAMNDMPLARTRCPQSLAPFADEVDERIRPLFKPRRHDSERKMT